MRRGATVARVVIETRDDEATHRLEVGFEPGEAKHLRVDGQRRRPASRPSTRARS